MGTREPSPLIAFIKRVRIDDETGCWRWTGQHYPDTGYARFRRDGFQSAHRWSHWYFVGDIPDGHEVDHVWARGCRYVDCVNPNHLEAVTPQENKGRSEKTRRTHCPAGHEYTPGNTYIKPNGSRNCNECRRISNQAWRERNPGYVRPPRR